MPADLPPLAVQYLPALIDEVKDHWPSVPYRSALAGQVEQETCPSLKSAKCWNPKAELKTSREYGFGLGQLTVTANFNAWEEVKRLDKSLANWSWDQRFDPSRQLRALVLKTRFNYQRFPAATKYEQMAFAFASYNGGVGGLINEIKICKSVAGCNPGYWFGHVELYSNKSRQPWQGYGRSAFEINREYPRLILTARRLKYIPYIGE